MGKKIAFITDIHGNATALEAALQEIDNRENIEHIYCLGDMVGIGHQTNEVLEMLFSRHDISMITGNHDEAVLALIKGEEYPESHNVGELRKHHEWIANDLDSSFIPKLENLPRYIHTIIDQIPIALIHYHIKKGLLTEHISKEPFSPIVEPSYKHIHDLFNDFDERLICFGHHHPVHLFQMNDQTFLNPGSLGCSEDPFAKYGIVNFNNGTIALELKEVKYERMEFIQQFQKVQVPFYKNILKIFYGI
ncbi:metallophosphatase family protein [Peribacillus frigoritolerans]|uniref:metallophosphoesterase family protein n=1 Tax=Peribacillus frigoritolerans TaxID=450367 RepID=UPI0021CE3E6A|nr:metallophosphoesterase family protein [Peribacillus frigoritolerans]MCU6598986.1 metallophosphatase family protein [Peribacillus frigoritolerans]